MRCKGPAIVLSVNAILSGCMASTLETLRHPPSAQEIREVFVGSGQKLIYELHRLMGSAPTIRRRPIVFPMAPSTRS